MGDPKDWKNLTTAECPGCYREVVVPCDVDEEAALAAEVVKAAEHCTAEGCTFSAWEGRYHALKDAVEELRAFRQLVPRATAATGKRKGSKS